MSANEAQRFRAIVRHDAANDLRALYPLASVDSLARALGLCERSVRVYLGEFRLGLPLGFRGKVRRQTAIDLRSMYPWASARRLGGLLGVNASRVRDYWRETRED